MLRHIVICRLYHMFLHYLISSTILGERLLNIKCVFWYSLQLISETFLIVWGVEQDIRNILTFQFKVPDSHVRFRWNLNFLDRFWKNTHIKFHESPSSWRWVVPCRQTDRHDEANNCFSKFCENAWEIKEEYSIITCKKWRPQEWMCGHIQEMHRRHMGWRMGRKGLLCMLMCEKEM